MVQRRSFIPAFSLPLGVYDLELGEDFNSELISFIDSLRQDTGNAQRSSVGGWRSEGNFFAQQNEAVQTLRRLCIDVAVGYLQECAANLPSEGRAEIFGWANWNGKGDFNTPHRHPGWDVCGCYYVRQPDATDMKSGSIEFLDHRNIPTKQQRLGGPVYSQSIELRPKPGELVVFPPMVSHWVPPNQGDDPRVVIAWNLNLEGN